MKVILKNNLSFLLPYFLFLLIGAVLIVLNSKAQTHLAFNSFHNSFLDTFNTYTTYLGDGFTASLLIIILLATKYRFFIIAALSNIIATLFAQFLKHYLFDDALRPKKFFEGIQELYFVPGIDNHLYHSFPSGHTTCAFALYFSFALMIKNQGIKFFLFFLAILTGYSRVYLSQHFFEDVYAGSLIGVTAAFLVFYFVQKKRHVWMDRSIVNFFNK